MGSFDDVYQRALREPERFWAEAAVDIDWLNPWQRVLDVTSASPSGRWFAGGSR
jgi:propionyl-CoA synthetase